MKRNFLLMLLLTILPFVGWAADPQKPAAADLVISTNNPTVNLVVAGSDDSGTFYYYSSDNESLTFTADELERNFQADVPTADSEGTYYVYWFFLPTGQSLNEVVDEVYKIEVEVSEEGGEPGEVVEPSEVVDEPDHIYHLSVSGVNTSTKAYGVALALTPNLITTNSQEVNNDPNLLNKVIGKLELKSDLQYAKVGQREYWLILKDGVEATTVTEEGGQFVYSYGSDYFDVTDEDNEVTRYIVKPTARGYIDVVKATDNEATNRGKVYRGLVYNGEPQLLIMEQTEVNYGEVKYHVSTTKVTNANIEYFDGLTEEDWVSYEDVKREDVGQYYVYFKVDETDEYNGVGPLYVYGPSGTSAAAATIVQLEPDYATAAYQPTGNTFAFNNALNDLAVAPVQLTANSKLCGTYYYYSPDEPLTGAVPEAGDEKWSTTIPQGIHVSDNGKAVYWYVGSTDNVKGIAPSLDQKVVATVTQATSSLAFAEGKTTIEGMKTTYYWKGEGNSIPAIATDLAAATNVVVTTDPTLEPIYNVEPTYFIEKRSGDRPRNYQWTRVENNNVTTTGTYRVNAEFAGNDDIAASEKLSVISNSANACPQFEVVKPTVTIKAVATPAIVGDGSTPTPSYEIVEWQDEQGTDKLTGTATYTYYRQNRWGNWVVQDVTNGLPLGTYQLRVSGLSAEYHEVEFTPATVTVAPGQVEAEIASYTGEDALIYGQNLPLQLTYVSGYGAGEGADEAIEDFNEAEWTSGQFKAENTETHEVYALYYGRIRTDINNVQGYYARLNGEGQRIALPVGTYKVSANFTSDSDSEIGAATIIAKTGTWEVVAKDINNTDVTEEGAFTVANIGENFDLTKTYTGEKITPTGADLAGLNGGWGISYRYTQLVYDVDYEITNVGENINAGTGTFTIKGKGNFTGEQDLEFTIDKLEIEVKPVIPAGGAIWQIGSTPNFKIDYDDLRTKLVGQDTGKYSDFDDNLEEQKGFKDLAVRVIAPTTVSTYPKGIEAYLPEDKEEADNYKFKPTTAPVTVTKGKINLKVKEHIEAEYNGTDVPEIAYDFEPIMTGDDASTLSEVMLDNGNWKTVIDAWNGTSWDLEFGLQQLTSEEQGRYRANTTYTITYDAQAVKPGEQFGGKTNAEKMVSMNYDVKVIGTTGSTDITEAPIEITVLKQDVKVKDEIRKAVTLVSPETGFGPTIAITKGGLKAGDTDIKKLVADELTVGDDNTLNLVENKSEYGNNYRINIIPGEWNLLADDLLVLESTEADWDKLTKYNNKPFTTRAVNKVTLTLLQPEMKKKDGTIEKFQWLKNQWNAMVLPFDAKASEISAYFGYAIVNVVNPDGVEEGNVVFKMPEITDIIPANHPFCVKAAKDIISGEKTSYTATFELDRDVEAGEVNYFEVVNPGTKQVSIAADNGDFGYTFDGTYEEQLIKKDKFYLRFFGKGNWSKIGRESSAVFDMMPYTGYVNLGEDFAGTREVNFIFEEEDGSTTAIKAVDFMNGNKANAEGLYRVDGIKLQSAPTQKGVYIQDGKKFVK